MSRVGESYLVGLIGSGISRSLTPPMHERAADLLGLRYLYRPLDIDSLGPNHSAYAAEECGEILEHALELGFNAFNVTHPCKQLIMQHLDSISASAAQMGAVNTVVLREGKTVGYNTDHSGFVTALQEGLAPSPEDLEAVVQLGAGGAGSATSYALLSQGTRQLFISDLSLAKAEEMAHHLQTLFPASEVNAITPENLPEIMPLARGLVNASPIGMHHHPGSPLDLSLLRADLWVADVIYLPQETPLIAHARSLGARVLPGGLMAVGQAVDAFELITGHRPDIKAMTTHFLSLLEG